MKLFIEKIREKLNIDLLSVVDINHTEYRQVLSQWNSVFVIGISYYWDQEEDIEDRYILSKYTRGLDYHQVLRKKLEGLEEELSSRYSFRSKIQVDIGPTVEKDLGVMSGLGQLGKNSLLINKDLGSYLFLGLLYTDLRLGIDNVRTTIDICKDCTRCIDSCPTGAITDSGVDTTKCLSSLSQMKDIYPDSSRLRWVYGCDICQDVCPYNKHIKKNLHREFRPVRYSLDRKAIEDMSNREFKRVYKDFAFSWVGRKIILRNMDILDKNVYRNSRDKDKNI